MKLDISIVIPVYNEERHINSLCQRLSRTMNDFGRSYEIILVDDGSCDNSFETMKSINKIDNNVKVIQFSRNFGQHPAVMAGFKFSRGEIVVTIDADLQNPPEEIPKLIEKLEQGFDMVSGWRIRRKDNSRRRIAAKFGNILVSGLTGIKLHDYGCMMRAYSRNIINQVLQCSERFKTIPILIACLLSPSSVAEVKVMHEARRYGKTNYSFYDLIRLTLSLLIGYSTLPIQIISLIGILTAIGGIGSIAAVFISYFIRGTFPSLTYTLIACFLFLYGILLFSIGLIGEYLGRIFAEVQGRPPFIIKSVLE